MTPLINETWNLICLGAKYICEENREIEIDKEKKVYIKENFIPFMTEFVSIC